MGRRDRPSAHRILQLAGDLFASPQLLHKQVPPSTCAQCAAVRTRGQQRQVGSARRQPQVRMAREQGLFVVSTESMDLQVVACKDHITAPGAHGS